MRCEWLLTFDVSWERLYCIWGKLVPSSSTKRNRQHVLSMAEADSRFVASESAVVKFYGGMRHQQVGNSCWWWQVQSGGVLLLPNSIRAFPRRPSVFLSSFLCFSFPLPLFLSCHFCSFSSFQTQPICSSALLVPSWIHFYYNRANTSDGFLVISTADCFFTNFVLSLSCS